jgi:hypothetical protein
VLEQVAAVFMTVSNVEELCDASKPQMEMKIRRNSLSLSLFLSLSLSTYISEISLCGLLLSSDHKYYNKLLQFSWL